MSAAYTTAQAAEAAGVSPSTIRNVTTGQFARHYAGFFSESARPGKGESRQLTAGDLKLLAYIRQQTAVGVPHEEVAAKIAAGAIEGFDWQPPPITEAGPSDHLPPEPVPPSPGPGYRAPSTPPEGAALVLFAQSAIAAQIQQARADLEAARLREEALQDRLRDAEARAARAEGELAALRRPFWRRLLG